MTQARETRRTSAFHQTNDGRVVRVSDMAEQHIRNALRLYMRNAILEAKRDKDSDWLSHVRNIHDYTALLLELTMREADCELTEVSTYELVDEERKLEKLYYSRESNSLVVTQPRPRVSAAEAARRRGASTRRVPTPRRAHQTPAERANQEFSQFVKELNPNIWL